MLTECYFCDYLLSLYSRGIKYLDINIGGEAKLVFVADESENKIQ